FTICFKPQNTTPHQRFTQYCKYLYQSKPSQSHRFAVLHKNSFKHLFKSPMVTAIIVILYSYFTFESNVPSQRLRVTPMYIDGSVHIEEDDLCYTCEYFVKGVNCPLLE